VLGLLEGRGRFGRWPGCGSGAAQWSGPRGAAERATPSDGAAELVGEENRGGREEEGERADGRAPVGRERKGRGGRARLGLGNWAMHAGEKRERGVCCWGEGRPKGERGKESRPGCFWAGFFSLFLLLSFFFSILKLFKQNYLNSHKFELKPYKLNTRETMLQHECTNMLTL
jgi:hypothetical protein